MNNALIVGHLSTFGDLVCLNILEDHLKEQNISFDTFALNKDARGQIGNIKNQLDINPHDYDYFILCCGPYWKEVLNQNQIFLEDFKHCKRVVFNTTMVNPIEEWAPFHLLFERDSNENNRVEFAFLHDAKIKPLISTCFLGQQAEYGHNQLHKRIITEVNSFMESRNDFALVNADTRFPLKNNIAGMRNVDDFTSIVSKSQVLITNRLHGTVFGLLSGVPVIAIDCVKGGDKVSAQCKKIGWPGIIMGDDFDMRKLNELLIWAMSNEAREKVQEVVGNSKETVLDDFTEFKNKFIKLEKIDKPQDSFNHFGVEKRNKNLFADIHLEMKTLVKQTLSLWYHFFKRIINKRNH